MDSDGKPYTQLRYRGGGPAAFMKILEDNANAKAKRDEMFVAAGKLEGKAKADAIQKAIESIGVSAALYPVQLKSLVAADPTNIFGMSALADGAMNAATDLASANKAFALFDKVLEKQGLTGEAKQKKLTKKLDVLIGLGELDAVGGVVDSLVKLAPGSRLSKGLKNFKENRLPKMKADKAADKAAEKPKVEAKP